MCLSTPKDNSAAIAREAEAKRQARIAAGTEAINKQFSVFDDSYYDQLQQSALDFYNPDLTRQAEDTREMLTKNLARSGNLSGSVGATTISDFEEELARQKALVGDKARNYAQGARAKVEQNRNALLNQLAATADPAAAAQAAASQAQTLSAPPEFSPLADVFGKFANLSAQQVAGARQGYDNIASRNLGIQPRVAADSSRIVA